MYKGRDARTSRLALKKAAKDVAALAVNVTRLRAMRAEPVSLDLDTLNLKLRWLHNDGAGFKAEGEAVRQQLSEVWVLPAS
jgi:hypothetical protein